MGLLGPPNVARLEAMGKIDGLVRAAGYKKDPAVAADARRALTAFLDTIIQRLQTKSLTQLDIARNALVVIGEPARDRLIFILQHLGVDVAVNDRWSILRAGLTEAGAFCFSVKADDGQPLGPCPIGALPSNVAGVDVRRHVGFSAPVAIDNARRDN